MYKSEPFESVNVESENNVSVLEWLTAPVSKQDFFENYFEKKHLILHRENSSYNSHLLSMERVDELLYSQVVKFPAVRMTNSKEEISADKYTMGDRVIPSQIVKHFSEGATLILSGLQEFIPTLGKFCNSLTREVGHKFQTNIYITPKESKGFNVHYDTHDVFVLQLSGTKKWRIYSENPIELPNKLQEFEKGKYEHGPLVDEFILNEGDLLYIPRGVMHDADTMDETSMHITLGMLGFTWSDLLIESILDLSKKDAKLREFLPCENILTSEIANESVDKFELLLDHLKSSLNLNEIMPRIRKELVRTQKLNLKGLLKTAEKIESVTPDTVFKIHEIVIVSETVNEENVIIEWSGKKVEFPIFVLPAIRFIIENKTKEISIKNIPDCLDDAGKMALMKRLAKEGLLAIL